MAKFIRILGALFSIHLLLMVGGCVADDECGGNFDSRFGITGFSITESRNPDEANLFNIIDVNENDTVRFDSLHLEMRASFQVIAAKKKGSFFNAAYACSPLPPTPIDTVANIQVFTLEQTGVISFDTLEEVTDQFDVIAFTEEGGFGSRVALSEFNTGINPAGTSYFLFPTVEPDSVVNIGYKIVVNFTDGDSFDASSKFLYISP